MVEIEQTYKANEKHPYIYIIYKVLMLCFKTTQCLFCNVLCSCVLCGAVRDQHIVISSGFLMGDPEPYKLRSILCSNPSLTA